MVVSFVTELPRERIVCYIIICGSYKCFTFSVLFKFAEEIDKIKQYSCFHGSYDDYHVVAYCLSLV